MADTLKQTFIQELKQALKRGDKLKCLVIRSTLAAVTNAEKAKMKELEDADILGIIAKQVKQHKESIEAFKNGNRQDLVDKEVAEMAVLEKYLPEQMPREDIIAIAKKAIDEVGAQGPHEKGKVMGRLMPQLKGKADGGVINAVVTELLDQ